MATLEFAPALQRHAAAPLIMAPVSSLQAYVLDEQGCVRKHVAVFLNGRLLHDRKRLDVPLAADDRIYIAQALSGG